MLRESSEGANQQERQKEGGGCNADSQSFDGPEVLVKVRTVGDGASTAKAWQQSKPAGGNVPRFNFETFDIDIEDIMVDKLQLVAWDVSRGQVAPSGPGGLNDNFLGEVAEDVTTETEGAS